MACNPFIPATCPELIGAGAAAAAKGNLGNSITDTVVTGLAGSVQEAVTWMARLLTAWILVPSTDLCPNDTVPGWIDRCAAADYPAQQLRHYLLPLTILIAVAGVTWQGIVITISRKGEPLLQAVRGVWTTALWGAIGVAGTHMALKTGDSYSMWILDKTIFSSSADPPDTTMSAFLGGLLLPEAGVAPFVIILMGVVVILVGLLQTILMVFREGSVVILAGLLQLAAAGTITRATSGWLPRVLGWTLAMVAYKPAAASIYATAFLLMRSPEKSGRNFVMGLAVLALSIIAMPALMKFFTWTTGGVHSGGGGLGMLGAGAAAGVHGAASIRGAVGGHSAAEHARHLDTSLGPSGGRQPTGAVTAPHAPTTLVDGGFSAAGESGTAMPATSMPAGTGATAAVSTGAAGGAAAAGAAAGPAAPIVVGGVAVAQAGAQTAKAAAATATSAMQDR